MKSLRARARVRLGWGGFLLMAAAATTAYLALPAGGLTQAIVYPAFAIVAFGVVLYVVRTRPVAHPRSWTAMAVGLASWGLADTVYTLLALSGDPVPYPSLADAFYIAGYVAIVTGTYGLVRGRGGPDRLPLIDAAIVAVGASCLLWVVFVQPGIQGADPIAAAVSVSYPALDLLLLALAVRVVLGAERHPFLWLLAGSGALYCAADLVYAWQALDGTYVAGSLLDAAWILGVLLIPAAVLHPSAAVLQPRRRVRRSAPRGRVALVAVASLVAPAIVAAEAIATHDLTVAGVALLWAVLFFLVVARLSTTLGQLTDTLRRQRKLEHQLTYRANYDSLTGLANRSLFESRLARAIAAQPLTTAVIFIDLDDFKSVNDSLGHPVGDELLRVVGGRLGSAVRASDTAARLGGDEFAILVSDGADEETARDVGMRVLAQFRRPLKLAANTVRVRASAGLALGAVGMTPADLMRNADIAMYDAKAGGKNQLRTYEASMHHEVARSYAIRSDLPAALQTDQFVVYYQPVFDLQTRAIVGVEALARWIHPRWGSLGPSEFLRQAADAGLMRQIGRRVLTEACRAATRWPRGAGQPRWVSVNLTPDELTSTDLLSDVTEALARSGLAPTNLAIEITENALLNYDAAAANLSQLRHMGVRLFLDDFGTGYSALGYLARVPFDVVKIDRSFVAAIDKYDSGLTLLRGVLDLCDQLQLTTVAEGLETHREVGQLRDLGCSYGQGYALARPMTHEDLLLRLKQERSDQARSGAELLRQRTSAIATS